MSSQVSTTKKLVSASALMASGTLVSRVLGFVRVMMIAFILGNGTRQADMLSIATSVPTFKDHAPLISRRGLAAFKITLPPSLANCNCLVD